MVGQLLHQFEGVDCEGAFGKGQACKAAQEMQDPSQRMCLRLSLAVPGLTQSREFANLTRGFANLTREFANLMRGFANLLREFANLTR